MLHGMALLWFLTPALTVPVAFTPAQGLAALGIACAAFVKGVTGMGFPVLGAPIAALFLDPQTTVVAITIPAFVMNIVQALQGGVSLALVRRLLPIFVAFVPSVIGGTIGLAMVSGNMLWTERLWLPAGRTLAAHYQSATVCKSRIGHAAGSGTAPRAFRGEGMVLAPLAALMLPEGSVKVFL